MKAADLRSKGADELQKELIELSREKFNLRMQRATGQLANSHKMMRSEEHTSELQSPM